MKISELLDDIRNKNLVLPEFQREYVWSKDQAKQLMVSLFKEYPVGGLLFWKTNDPPELKNIDVLPETLGNIAVILDGQQRLTTLYMLIEGQIPPYYKDIDITNDPRMLYFNLEDGDFQYFQATRMRGNPIWQPVVNCFNHGVDAFEIVGQQDLPGNEAFKLAGRYQNNLMKLQQIKALELPAQIVPTHAAVEEAIDIFDRVNSQGTKLTDAELALTHITAKWPQARREMKEKIEQLGQKNFYFDLTFTTRALTGIVTKRALFEHIHKRPKEDLLPGWDQLDKILNYLVSVLPGHAKIHSTEDVNTTNAFIPIVVYLALNGNHFPNESERKKAIHWLYAALLWSRYTAQTDQRLERDLSIVVRQTSPWDLLEEQIIDQRGRIDVKANDLEGRGSQHPIYRVTYVISKQLGAIDWFNGAPLGTTFGKSYRLHSHHIFPQSILYKNGFDSDNHLHRKHVNSIANRAFLTADTNWAISNTAPEEYLPEVEEKYPGALASQFVPMDPNLWRVERYLDFLDARRDLIARNINEFMNGLVGEPTVMHERAIAELIPLGESVTLEFKSTLQWDVVNKQAAKHLSHSVMKTIAALLNSEGGTLIIGVEDNGAIFGLENDMKLVKGKSLDGFEQHLTSLISSQIGPEFSRFISIRFEQIEGKFVCAVDIDKAPEPAFLKVSQGVEFYTRLGNTSRILNAEEMHRYIQMNWS